MASAVNEWLRTYPAVRLQHRADTPVGKGLEAWQDSDGATWLKSLIVHKAAKKMARSGVLAAYSIGIAEPVTKQSARARRYEIVGGRLAEVSLVDSPSNARCGIRVLGKSAGGGLEYLGKAWNVPKSKKQKAVEKALSGDPAAYAAWLAKQAAAGPAAVDEVAAWYFNSSDQQVREMAFRALGDVQA